MSFRRYVASGRRGPLSVPQVLAASVLGGVATGVVEALLSQWFSLLLLFPALIGGVAGGLAGVVIRRRLFRAPALAMVLGVTGGAAGYVAQHGVEYLRFRATVAEALASQPSDAGATAAPLDIDQGLRAGTGHDGFVGYLVLIARTGVSIKRLGDGDRGLDVTGTGAWALWACELLIAAGIAGWLARSRAAEPFCERCDAWYTPPTRLAVGGDASSAERKRVRAALAEGNFEAVAAVFGGRHGRRVRFSIAASSCPRCGGDAYCALERISVRRAAQTSLIDGWLMSKDELARLTAALATARG